MRWFSRRDYGGGVILYRQKIANMKSFHGDSGGPIFNGTTAIGILSGITCSGSCDSLNNVTGTIYSHIVHSKNATGVEVYLGG